jgi:hypothetical protein
LHLSPHYLYCKSTNSQFSLTIVHWDCFRCSSFLFHLWLLFNDSSTLTLPCLEPFHICFIIGSPFYHYTRKLNVFWSFLATPTHTWLQFRSHHIKYKVNPFKMLFEILTVSWVIINTQIFKSVFNSLRLNLMHKIDGSGNDFMQNFIW